MKDLPPGLSPARRLRGLFFSSVPAGLCTVAVGAALACLFAFLWRWGVSEAVFAPDAQACRDAAGRGACWGFVAEKWRLILFGRFPWDEQWRAAAAVAAVVLMLAVSAVPAMWRAGIRRLLAAGWTLTAAAFFALLYGGFAGLRPVDTDQWGGLPLTVILTVLGMTVSVPLGIALAYGRRSRLPLVRVLCAGYIELVRGIPLIMVLFMASFALPLLFPGEMRWDPFWRVAWGIILFQSAYMAETVRAGLQTVPETQVLAARSLGLRPLQTQLLVVLPQALSAVIPAFVNSLLSTFMDTSLVTVVSMFDLTGSLQLALGDALWRDFFREGYIFVGAVYFAASFAISRYSQWLENYLRGPRRR